MEREPVSRSVFGTATFGRYAMKLARFARKPRREQWQAVDEFLAQIGDNLILIPDKSGTAMIRKRRWNPPDS